MRTPLAHVKRKKIAILGGGMGALTAAFELTRRPGWEDRYEITVYQAGHRLGGKGASSRNPGAAQRIEEHGLHVLMGWYENAFDVLRACYAELGRAPGEPLATIDEAFHPSSFIVVTEEVKGRWEPWPLVFPPLPGEPGDGVVTIPSPVAYVRALLGWARRLFAAAPETKAIAPLLDQQLAKIERQLTARPRGGEGGGDPERAGLERMVDQLMNTRARGPGGIGPFAFLDLAARLCRFDVEDPEERLRFLVRGFKEWLWAQVGARVEESTPLRRLWILLDLSLTTALGLIADGAVLSPDRWEALDDTDLQAWLSAHGAAPITCDSAPVRSLYNLAFSAPGEISTGTAIQGVLRMCFTYKGSVFYKMQAGMGETVFAPLYLVLKRRGVRFEFFHRVDSLALTPDRSAIAAIEVGRQATPRGGAYDPLSDVDGLPCWPLEPKYEALVEGDAIRAACKDSDPRMGWEDVERRTLLAGRDFDDVILGISLGALPVICEDLVAAGGPFARMVEHVKTTQTQAAQLWLSPTLREVGWDLEPPVLDGFAAPFDTWADMTHLLPRERWPEEHRPGALFYLCSRFEERAGPPGEGPEERHERQEGEARDNVVRWLNESAGALWPRAVTRDGFDWSLLVDPEGRSGVARLDAQYVHGAHDPSDRYVLAVPGSTRHRLRAHESGYDNLVLAGDWVKTGLSAGCLEAATMGGKQAARAISGEPAFIPGDLPAPEGLRAKRASRGLPAYVGRGGDVVIRQPLRMEGVTAQWLFAPARLDALQALVDRALNDPAGGAVEYRVLGPFVALVLADIARGQARDVPHRDKGWFPERDVAFWVPVLAGKRVAGVFVLERLVWFLPYVLVNNPAAAATGREIFGFPKEPATMLFPGDPGAKGAYSIDALLIRRYDVSARAEIGRLITVTPEGSVDPACAWPAIEDGFHALGARLAAGVLPGVTAADAALLVQSWLGLEMGMVFLKQFRDAHDPSRACYRAIVEAPAKVDAWRRGGALPPHRVRIEPADSHPIAAELGLASGEVECPIGMWVDYDFTMHGGVVMRSEP